MMLNIWGKKLEFRVIGITHGNNVRGVYGITAPTRKNGGSGPGTFDGVGVTVGVISSDIDLFVWGWVCIIDNLIGRSIHSGIIVTWSDIIITWSGIVGYRSNTMAGGGVRLIGSDIGMVAGL